MKKLIYLFVACVLFISIACNPDKKNKNQPDTALKMDSTLMEYFGNFHAGTWWKYKSADGYSTEMATIKKNGLEEMVNTRNQTLDLEIFSDTFESIIQLAFATKPGEEQKVDISFRNSTGGVVATIKDGVIIKGTGLFPLIDSMQIGNNTFKKVLHLADPYTELSDLYYAPGVGIIKKIIKGREYLLTEYHIQ